MNNFIDFSQHKVWLTCPGVWFEKYLSKRQKQWNNGGQRDDPFAIGSMVHEGLREWQQFGRIGVPIKCIEEIGPTREALNQCEEMLHGYAQTYPQEKWKLNFCEEPLRFPLIDGVDGLAKIDQFFYVPEDTDLPQGLEEETLTLSKGWWIQEYKTKNPDIDRGLWMMGWVNNLQISYQILALQNYLKIKGLDGDVQGALVSVIEKPKFHIPKRKCKVCLVQYEYSSWIPSEDKFKCPVCGNLQELQKLKETPTRTPPMYFRMVVTRGRDKLEYHKRQMIEVSLAMDQVRGDFNWGIKDPTKIEMPLNLEKCVEPSYRKKCEYFNNHSNGLLTIDDPTLVDVEDYVKEKVEEEN